MSTKKELIKAIVSRLQEISERVFGSNCASISRYSLQTILGDENYAITFGSLPYSEVVTMNLAGVSVAKILSNHTEEALVDIKAIVDGITEERIAQLVEQHKPREQEDDSEYHKLLNLGYATAEKARKTMSDNTTQADTTLLDRFADINKRAYELVGNMVMVPRDDYSCMDTKNLSYCISDMTEALHDQVQGQTNAKLATKCEALIVELDALQLANRGTAISDTNIVVGQLPNVKPRPKFSAAGLIENGKQFDVVLAKPIQFKYSVANVIPLGVVIDPTTIKFVSKVSGIVPVTIRNHPTFGTMIMVISESPEAIKLEADSVIGHIERI